MTSLRHWLTSGSPWPWLLVVALTGATSVATPEWMSVLVFLIVPITGAAWTGSYRSGFATAAFATLVAVGVEWVKWDVTDPVTLAWEVVSRLAVYGLIAYLVAKQCQLVRQQQRLAAIDPLTGALNRGAFFERVESELARARRHEREVSLIYLDVDDLKVINDTEGHETGDRHLVSLVGTTVSALRRHDVVGRLGGDEFAVLLPETGEHEAELLADRLRRALLRSPARRPIYASMGLVTHCEAPADADELLRRADALMYVAKRSGSGIAKEPNDQTVDDSNSAITSAQSSREPNIGSST